MNGLYRFGRIVTSLLFRLSGVTVIGRENILDNEAMIVVCNHTSFADPPAMAMVYPHQLTFIAKESFAHNPFTRNLFGALGAVFLKKDESDIGAMRVMMNELKNKRPVALFPEGRRNFDQQLSEFMPGASYLSLRSGAPVQPMAVLNTGDIFRFWKRNIIVLIGRPIAPPQEKKLDKELLNAYSEQYRDQIVSLLAQGKEILAASGRQMRIPPKKRQKFPAKESNNNSMKK